MNPFVRRAVITPLFTLSTAAAVCSAHAADFPLPKGNLGSPLNACSQ